MVADKPVSSVRSLGSLASVEDLKSGRQGLTVFVMSSVLISAISGVLFGFDNGFTNYVVHQDDFRSFLGWPLFHAGQHDPTWVAGQMSQLNSFYPLGCAVTAPFAGWISDRFGRWKTMLGGVVLFFVGAIMMTAANGWNVLIAGRFLTGFAIGVLSMVVPVFMSEIAPVHMRGSLITVQQIAITFGSLFANVWSLIVQKAVSVEEGGWGWRLQFGMQLVLLSIMAVGLIIMPESPRWLVNNGQADKARALLKKLRGSKGEEATNKEIEEIEEEAREHKGANDGSFLELFGSKVIFATLIACFIPLGQQMTGVNNYMTMSSTIYSNMGLDGNMMALGMNILGHLAVYPALFTIERIGRKVPLLVTSGAIAAIMAMMAIIGWTTDPFSNKPAAYTAVVLSWIYFAVFQNAWGPMGWAIPAEVFPLRVRGKGVGIATFFNWFGNFAVTMGSPLALNSAMGNNGYNMLFACLMLFIVSPCLIFLLPETKNVPLEEMEAKFDKPLGEYMRSNATELIRRKPAQHDDAPEGAQV